MGRGSHRDKDLADLDELIEDVRAKGAWEECEDEY